VSRIPTASLPLLATLACTGGAPRPDAADTFRRLHEPLVRAQALPADPEAVHAHLAPVLDGEALTRAFLQTMAGARRRAESGARVDVETVAYESVELRSRSAGRTVLDAEWVVTGTVHHGDHAHRRATRYAGRYTVASTPLGPRITAERARDAVRLPAPPPGADASTSALELLGAGG
jgi:hypothetical protein